MADETRADEPKKTETLEIRLAPELKEALRRTAEAEGRSLSVVMRGLIDDYLARARRPRSTIKEIAMFFRHPVRLLAVAVGGVAIALFGLTSGQAQDLSLELNLEIWSYDVPPTDFGAIKKARNVTTTVTATYGEPSNITIASTGEAAGLVIDIMPEPVDAQSYLLHVTLREVNGEESTVIASPVLQATFGQPAAIEVDLDTQSGYRLQVLGDKVA